MTTIVPGPFSQLPCREVDRGLKRGPPRPFRHPRSPEEWIRRKSELEERNWISPLAKSLTHTQPQYSPSLSISLSPLSRLSLSLSLSLSLFHTHTHTHQEETIAEREEMAIKLAKQGRFKIKADFFLVIV